jgi:hypothetical protein
MEILQCEILSGFPIRSGLEHRPLIWLYRQSRQIQAMSSVSSNERLLFRHSQIKAEYE